MPEGVNRRVSRESITKMSDKLLHLETRKKELVQMLVSESRSSGSADANEIEGWIEEIDAEIEEERKRLKEESKPKQKNSEPKLGITEDHIPSVDSDSPYPPRVVNKIDPAEVITNLLRDLKK